MIRRRLHQRSVDGCLTCKERHIRCDETLPYCRNCLRVGKECRYRSTRSTSQEELEAEEASAGLLQAVQHSNMAQMDATQFPGYFQFLHQQAVSPAALEMIQQSREITRMRPMPPSCMLTITQDYMPKYNFLASQFECVKHALVSFAAYTHFQGTGSPVSEDIWMRHTSIALGELQKEIATFSQQNSDAIVTASVALASTAYDWKQWAVFVDGYSKALSQIRSHGFNTNYPDLLKSSFQMTYISANANPLYPHLSQDPVVMKQHILRVKTGISHLSRYIEPLVWASSGFDALEKLAAAVDHAVCFQSDEEIFHGLAWLRSWLFWIDLRRDNFGDDQHALTATFNALVLSILPIFPPKYSLSIRQNCVSKMAFSSQQMTEDTGLSAELASLVDVAMEWYQEF